MRICIYMGMKVMMHKSKMQKCFLVYCGSYPNLSDLLVLVSAFLPAQIYDRSLLLVQHIRTTPFPNPDLLSSPGVLWKSRTRVSTFILRHLVFCSWKEPGCCEHVECRCSRSEGEVCRMNTDIFPTQPEEEGLDFTLSQEDPEHATHQDVFKRFCQDENGREGGSCRSQNCMRPHLVYHLLILSGSGCGGPQSKLFLAEETSIRPSGLQ